MPASAMKAVINSSDQLYFGRRCYYFDIAARYKKYFLRPVGGFPVNRIGFFMCNDGAYNELVETCCFFDRCVLRRIIVFRFRYRIFNSNYFFQHIFQDAFLFIKGKVFGNIGRLFICHINAGIEQEQGQQYPEKIKQFVIL